MRGKLTEAQRRRLLDLYLSRGFHAAKPLAEQLGVNKRYMSNLARKRGYHDNYHRGDDRVCMPKSKYIDPRWAWAKERGAIIA